MTCGVDDAVRDGAVVVQATAAPGIPDGVALLRCA